MKSGVTEFSKALRLKQCSIFVGQANKWDTVNSAVFSLPAMPLSILRDVCDFENVSCSLVRVSGPTTEPMHYHTSYILGVVVRGTGTLLNRSSTGVDRQDNVQVGDVVIIPRGAPHVFTTQAGETMEYTAFEFSDAPIDYQAHLPIDK